MKLTAVLLAGGESRRMNTEKATIIFNGEPLWQRQIKLLRHLGPENILVSARADQRAHCRVGANADIAPGSARSRYALCHRRSVATPLQSSEPRLRRCSD